MDQDSKQELKRDMQEASLTLDRHAGPVGGLTSFNIEHGFVEAILRGLRSGFLKSLEYKQLVQCETLEDVKLTLGDSDYGVMLQNLNKLTPEIILDRCQAKFVNEFNFMRSQALGCTSTFMEMITYEYLIQSISFIVTALIKGSNPESLLNKIHPLGRSPHLKSVMTFDNVEGDGLVELYRTVLVDTPVAPYFAKYFSQKIRPSEATSGSQASGVIQKLYNEIEIDVITNMLQKLWLEDFYEYTQSLGGETAPVMKELLEFEADRRAISITLNSFGTTLNDPAQREKERKELYCSFGTLYPQATEFDFCKVGDVQQLQAVLQVYPQWRDLFPRAQEKGVTVFDILSEMEVRLNKLAFDGQSHLASFWAFVKLKRQEERNLKWILACVNQRRSEREKSRYIPIF